MRQKHIAFCLAEAYGHIVPTLGIALELQSRGHHVSYAVTKDFEIPLTRIGVQPVILDFLDTRSHICRFAQKENGTYDFSSNPQLDALIERLKCARTADSLSKLERAYEEHRPDIIIHDDCFDTAGRDLASKWGIPKIRHWPMLWSNDWYNWFNSDSQIIISLPKFLIDESAMYDDRFHFVGFVPEGRKEFFEPWTTELHDEPTIVVSSTTGLLPQVEFCKLMIDAFGNQPWRIVLSAGGKHDPLTEVRSESFKTLPDNFRFNHASSTFEIMKGASLFVGQGQQGSPLEALYCGVPILTIPTSPVWYDTLGRRLEHLGVGSRLALSGDVVKDAQAIRLAAKFVMHDPEIRRHVRLAQGRMHQDTGAKTAADLICSHLETENA